MRTDRNRGSRRALGLGTLCVGALCVGLLAAAGPVVAPDASAAMSIWQKVDHRCRRFERESLAPYPWPLAPFHTQHAVRGYFGDPRTVFPTTGAGSFSFHNGIDISAWPGNHVYPVLSGVAIKVSGDLVVVRADDTRRFRYQHLRPAVTVGERVLASRTVLGSVYGTWNHVHLSELRGNCSVNPLLRRHLTPYRDSTTPTVRAILFQSPGRHTLSPARLTGQVRILADAFDTPAIPNPFPWGSAPVAPAKLTWQLTTPSGRVVAHNMAVDFRYGEPLRQQFCAVYAPGTEQNFAAVGGTFHWGKHGRYLYDLTPRMINTSRLPPGRYRVTVRASDTRGNRGARTELIRIARTGATGSREAADSRCVPPGT